MAHFAKVKDGLVTQVIVIDNKHEANATKFITETLGFEGNWLQTSFNTWAGKHAKAGTPLRKNFAAVGYSYDKDLDAFIPPKPFESWILNEDTCQWVAPVSKPTDAEQSDLQDIDENTKPTGFKSYRWNESIVNWELVETEEN